MSTARTSTKPRKAPAREPAPITRSNSAGGASEQLEAKSSAEQRALVSTPGAKGAPDVKDGREGPDDRLVGRLSPELVPSLEAMPAAASADCVHIHDSGPLSTLRDLEGQWKMFHQQGHDHVDHARPAPTNEPALARPRRPGRTT